MDCVEDADTSTEAPQPHEEPKRLSREGRVRSWERVVVVYVEANDALYMAEKDKIKGKHCTIWV